MPEGTEPDPTDQGTQHLNIALLQEKGAEFIPFEYLDFEFEITLPIDTSADNPITLFTLYYTLEIIESIVQYTNNLLQEAQDPSKLYTQTNQQYSTYKKEIYIFIAIWIYITLFPIDEITNYWSSNKLFSKHLITQYISRNWF